MARCDFVECWGKGHGAAGGQSFSWLGGSVVA